MTTPPPPGTCTGYGDSIVTDCLNLQTQEWLRLSATAIQLERVRLERRNSHMRKRVFFKVLVWIQKWVVLATGQEHAKHNWACKCSRESCPPLGKGPRYKAAAVSWRSGQAYTSKWPLESILMAKRVDSIRGRLLLKDFHEKHPEPFLKHHDKE